MRVFRIVSTPVPGPEDFCSYWDLGRRPSNPAQNRAYRGVSSFVSYELAAAKAIEYELGAHVAELELPDTTETDASARGHVNIYGVTPEILVTYVVGVRPAQG